MPDLEKKIKKGDIVFRQLWPGARKKKLKSLNSSEKLVQITFLVAETALIEFLKKLDEHEHRAEYAKRVYLHYERDLDKLSEQEKTRLRKELRGQVLDNFAELRTSEALGHGRDGEFRKSYVYKLVE
ncbi:hypothetical protein ACTGZO_10285 [Streptococcus suis]